MSAKHQRVSIVTALLSTVFQEDDDVLLERAALGRIPPEYCPCCHDTAKSPVKDEYGRWTWNCMDGCNP